METFEQAWARMAAQGYQYGEEALEHVKLGWKLKCSSIWDSIPENDAIAESFCTVVDPTLSREEMDNYRAWFELGWHAARGRDISC